MLTDLRLSFQMHSYERLVRLLLRIMLVPVQIQENFVQRISIYLLNSLACQVDHAEKELVGKLGAFTVGLLLGFNREQGFGLLIAFSLH